MLIEHELEPSEILLLSHYHIEVERIVDAIVVIVLYDLFDGCSREGLSDEPLGEESRPLVPPLELLEG